MEIRRNDEQRDKVTKGNQIFIKTLSFFSDLHLSFKEEEKMWK